MTPAGTRMGYARRHRFDSSEVRPMKRLSLAALLLCLAGCAKINDAGMRLVASSTPAFAVVNGTLLGGTVSLHVDRTGTLSLDAREGSGLKCMGRLRYTATQSGVVNLQCSDGTDAQLNFTAIRETSGYGSGRTAKGLASLVFGLEAADAPAYLHLPAGRRMVTAPEGGARLE